MLPISFDDKIIPEQVSEVYFYRLCALHDGPSYAGLDQKANIDAINDKPLNPLCIRALRLAVCEASPGFALRIASNGDWQTKHRTTIDVMFSNIYCCIPVRLHSSVGRA